MACPEKVKPENLRRALPATQIQPACHQEITRAGREVRNSKQIKIADFELLIRIEK